MSYGPPEYDGLISMTFFFVFSIDRARLRINMGVGRIIFLLAVIRIVENQAAPYASGGTTCRGLRWKCLSELHSAANEADLLTDIVESTRPAIVRRATIDGGSAKVGSPGSFAEFKEKSQVPKVYRSHSLQCVDHKKVNTSRSTSTRTELNGTEKENSFQKNTTRLALKTIKEFDEKRYNTSDDCSTETNKNLMKVSPCNVVVKSLKTTAPLTTLFADSSSSRLSRALKTIAKQPKKGTLEGKSNKKLTRKVKEAKTHEKVKNIAAKREKGARRNIKVKHKKGARKNMNVDAANKKTNSIRTRTKSTQKPWNELMGVATKSLTKTKVGEETKSWPKQAKRPEGKSARKSAVKTSAAAAYNTKSLSTRNRAIQQQKFLSKRQKSIKSWSALKKPETRKTITQKNRKGNRDTRELNIAIAPGTTCSADNSRQNSFGHLVKRDFSFHIPIACTTIKISNCGNDCSNNKGKEKPPRTSGGGDEGETSEISAGSGQQPNEVTDYESTLGGGGEAEASEISADSGQQPNQVTDQESMQGGGGEAEASEISADSGQQPNQVTDQESMLGGGGEAEASEVSADSEQQSDAVTDYESMGSSSDVSKTNEYEENNEDAKPIIEEAPNEGEQGAADNEDNEEQYNEGGMEENGFNGLEIPEAVQEQSGPEENLPQTANDDDYEDEE